MTSQSPLVHCISQFPSLTKLNWLDVWDGLMEWVIGYEIPHVLQKFSMKIVFDAFDYSFLG